MSRPISTRRRALTAVVVLVLAAVGCAGPSLPSVTVGAVDAPESLVLAHVYAGALRGSGAAARVETVTDPMAELDTGSVTVVPALTGTLLQMLAPKAGVRSGKQVYRAMIGALPEGIAAGDYATAAEDKPALVVTEATADDWGSTQLQVLPAHCDGLVTGAVAGARTPPATVGRCQVAAERQFPDDTALFAALRAGEVTAAWSTTADPDIPDDLVVLADRAPALVPAEDVVPLYRRNELAERQVLALNEVAGELDTAALADMRGQVADGADPQAVADAWLADHPLGR